MNEDLNMPRLKTSSSKEKKKVRVLPLFLALQMFLPTQALAQSAEQNSGQTDNWVKTAEIMKSANQLGQDFLKLHQARMQQEQAQAQMQNLQQKLF